MMSTSFFPLSRQIPIPKKKQEDPCQNLLLFFVSYIIAMNDNSILKLLLLQVFFTFWDTYIFGLFPDIPHPLYNTDYH